MDAEQGSLQVVVLAAGKGVRMRSDLPKVLHRVCGWSLLERVLRAAAGLRPQRIVVVVGYGFEVVKREIERIEGLACFSGVELTSILQSEQKGTGHAVQTALPALRTGVGERILILPGDTALIETASLAPLLESALTASSPLAVLTAEHPEPAGYGRILRGGKGEVLGIVEHGDAGDRELEIREINSSIYLCEGSFLARALAGLSSENAQGEYYLTDIVGRAVCEGASVLGVKASHYLEVAGANTRYELSLLEGERRQRISRAHMEAGVSMEDPGRVYIDEEVQIGVDSFIGSGTRLRGRTVLGRQVVIEGESLLVDARVGDRSRVLLGSYIESSTIGPDCSVGPFAHLRPGSELVENVKVGNFVEVKKSRLARGVKANHLTYLGDALVGEGVNVGAGTITCNYDGKNKHQTQIEDNCFVGSNSCLVAPVKVGRGAYIGAGSTITKDVPAEALGLGRERQVNIEGWAKRKARREES